MSKYTIKIAQTDGELKEYFRIRNEVFVKEQKIFPETDIDGHDQNAIHIIAVESSSSNVVGVVRCYSDDGHTWFGGRLGAIPDYRNGRVGSRLVRFAVSTAKSKGCKKFLAYIQPNNVRFFQRLDWEKLGEPIIYQGIPHQLMEANLDSY
jgi:putative N-acetyltransferase (TIGR04045 family)